MFLGLAGFFDQASSRGAHHQQGVVGGHCCAWRIDAAATSAAILLSSSSLLLLRRSSTSSGLGNGILEADSKGFGIQERGVVKVCTIKIKGNFGSLLVRLA